ncbi:uncharacterized protein [Temnothorax nylanderi]|uniref:uncharacterized protein n=1 Tax=Temnothorax nylanderi TaxID=102681 RepID=UPI003A88E3A6
MQATGVTRSAEDERPSGPESSAAGQETGGSLFVQPPVFGVRAMFVLSISFGKSNATNQATPEIKKHFKDAKLQAAVVHWDGKLLPALTGKETVDRLPVILSNNDTEQLLGVPGLQSGTGKQQASAVCETLAEWGFQNYVKALVFDTTATNTGRFNGACVLIENFLEKDLLYLPCRHHIYEIILRSVFEEKMGKTTGPNVLIFKKFQNAWSGINVHNFRSGIENEKVKGHLNQGDITRILDFVRNTLREQQPREDYREFLELTAIFLGEAPPRGISFRVPGAIHHARWMAKAIYCLKIFLFRGEFILSLQEENAICDICIFLVSVYVEAWFCAPSAIKAPYLDFRVLSKFFEYQAIDRGISRVALQKLSNHLWYLSPEVVALAFFDTNLSFESKIKMVNALNRETESSNKNKKRIKVQIDKIPEIVNNGIEQFVSTETRRFFKRFDLNDEFLKTEPLTWHKNESFVKGLELVNKLRVVNDSAERGFKLMEDYNKLFTKNEQQKQYVLQIVSDYRRKFPGYKKETLSQPLSVKICSKKK